jgi:hypothetical protein
METKTHGLLLAPLLLAFVSALNAQPTFSNANWISLADSLAQMVRFMHQVHRHQHRGLQQEVLSLVAP